MYCSLTIFTKEEKKERRKRMNSGIVKIQKNGRIMEEVAELYCEVFKEPPWNEGLKSKEVMETMREQFGRPGVIALAHLESDKVISFAWMYRIFKSDLDGGTRYSPELGFLFEDQKRVFYLQEIGVKKKKRQRGIGEKLIRELLARGKGNGNGASVVVLSTNSKARSIVLLISKIGFQSSEIVRPPKELERTYWILKLEN